MQKTASILLAFVFLVSSSHLSFATHYCGGHIFSHEIVLNNEGLGCDMDETSSQEKLNECESEHNCCDTEVIEFNIKDYFQASESSLTFKPPFVLAKVATLLFVLPVMEQSVAVCQYYKPPLPDKDIPVLLQSFLI